MSKSSLIFKVKKQEQRGSDTFLELELSENDGPKSISLEVTLHNVDALSVDVQEGGMQIITKEGAPIIVNIRKPVEVMM